MSSKYKEMEMSDLAVEWLSRLDIEIDGIRATMYKEPGISMIVKLLDCYGRKADVYICESRRMRMAGILRHYLRK